MGMPQNTKLVRVEVNIGCSIVSHHNVILYDKAHEILATAYRCITKGNLFKCRWHIEMLLIVTNIQKPDSEELSGS